MHLLLVTKMFGIPTDNDDDEAHKREFYASKEHGHGHVDGARKKAGSVENYKTKGSKKKTSGGGGGKAHKKG